MGEPAKLKGLHQATNREMSLGHRRKVMLRAICDVCAPNTQRAHPEWWKDCPHHPYIGTKTETVIERVYEDGPDGSRVVTGTTTTEIERPWPNLAEVSMSLRINSGQGIEKARAKGFILPSELRDDAYPDGIAEFCEMSRCFSQEGLKTYPNGVYCRQREAAHIYEDDRGKAVEFLNMEKRSTQIDDAMARVGAGK